ncbi:MAG: hypothetical protein Fur009_3530 [Candidatus Microgenomates bacterium]
MSDQLAEQFFANVKRVFDARARLFPKRKETINVLLNPNLLSQPLYSYEQAIIEIWAGLIERENQSNKQLGNEDFESIKTILSWIKDLKPDQINAELLKNRRLPPMFMDKQTKGVFQERLSWLDNQIEKYDPNAFNNLMSFFNNLMNQMYNSGNGVINFNPKEIKKAILSE